MKKMKVKENPSKGPPKGGDAPVQGRLTKQSLAALQRAHSAEEGREGGEAAARPSSVPIVKDKDTASVATSRQTKGAKVEFTSFLDELPVEACLEYLTRPHRSWDSAATYSYDRQRRIEDHRASVFARSLNASRNASLILNSSMRSTASAPAGFPRSASNGSKSKTGSLVPSGRLGSPTPSAEGKIDLELRVASSHSRTASRASNTRSVSPGQLMRGSTTAPKPVEGKGKGAPKKKSAAKKGKSAPPAGGGGLDLAIGPSSAFKIK
ncbi:hypothetical protein AGDE_15619 [Angomonas deanei]|nr:hypothetical protein AGDE_15619 [Angomonas deanei]|eukprot:EPY18760.1 hypothetical protein AGDE_15619 [Angomonas deanei]